MITQTITGHPDPIDDKAEIEHNGDECEILAGNNIGEPDPEDTTLDPTFIPDAEDDKATDNDE